MGACGLVRGAVRSSGGSAAAAAKPLADQSPTPSPPILARCMPGRTCRLSAGRRSRESCLMATCSPVRVSSPRYTWPKAPRPSSSPSLQAAAAAAAERAAQTAAHAAACGMGLAGEQASMHPAVAAAPQLPQCNNSSGGCGRQAGRQQAAAGGPPLGRRCWNPSPGPCGIPAHGAHLYLSLSVFGKACRPGEGSGGGRPLPRAEPGEAASPLSVLLYIAAL